MGLSLTKLKSFVAVAECQSCRAAAEQVHLSTSAISAHIQQLETFLQIQLIQRTTRSMKLTPEGDRFLAGARSLIEASDRLVRETKAGFHTRNHTVRIACSPVLTGSILPAAIKAFEQRYPDAPMRVLDGHGAQIAEWLMQGEADVGLGSKPENDDNFTVSPLVADRFVVVMPPDHELASRSSVKLHELTPYPFLAMRSSHGVRAAFERAVDEAGVSLRVEQELVHHYSLGQLIRAGLGISAIPSLNLPLLNMRDLIVVPISDPPILRQLCVIKRRGIRLPYRVKQFLLLVAAEAQHAPQIHLAPPSQAGAPTGPTLPMMVD